MDFLYHSHLNGVSFSTEKLMKTEEIIILEINFQSMNFIFAYFHHKIYKSQGQKISKPQTWSWQKSILIEGLVPKSRKSSHIFWHLHSTHFSCINIYVAFLTIFKSNCFSIISQTSLRKESCNMQQDGWILRTLC